MPGNVSCVPSADADAVKERHKLRGWTGRPTYGNYGPVKSRDGSVLSDDNPVYWWCAPEEKDFPTPVYYTHLTLPTTPYV